MKRRSTNLSLSGNNQTPTITLSQPADNARLVDVPNLRLQATAADANGGIARVEFWANGSKLGESLNSPYILAWPSPRNPGNHNIHARAFDLSGLSTSTATIGAQTIPFRLVSAQVQHLSNPVRHITTLQFTLPANRS